MMRTGPVFADRYHVEIVDSPTQARNALAYVLLNWRKHGEDREPTSRTWLLDPYSSALSFTGWIDAPGRWATPEGYRPLPTHAPTTWLLRTGWTKGGAISMVGRPTWSGDRGRR